MVMKDKLVKTHHKGMYYKARKAGIFLAGGIAFATIIAVPTYMSLNSTPVSNESHAEEKKPEEKAEKQVTLLTYYNLDNNK